MNIFKHINPEGKESIVIQVKVKPRAMMDSIVGILDDGTLRVAVTAAPEKGKANKAIEKLLKKELDASAIKILSGFTTQKKMIKITF